MVMESYIFNCEIIHNRLEPKKNYFRYKNWSLFFDIEQMQTLSIPFLFGVNKWGLFSLHNKDHGYKDGKSMIKFIQDIFKKTSISLINKKIFMITMPRLFGYVFNPVSFWLITEKMNQKICSVLCEVNNTFGETHSYVCLPKHGKYITKNMIIKAEKLFHVSPFMPRSGKYTFKFMLEDKKLGFWINYYRPEFKKPFSTSMVGNLEAYSKKNLIKKFFKYPYFTFRVVFLIHYQAIKLFF